MAYSSVYGSYAWRPGVWQRFPWLGFLQIFGALLGVAASIAILIASDGALISDWRYAPTVYLSISYTISNLLLAAAFSEGVTVSSVFKLTDYTTDMDDIAHLVEQGDQRRHSPRRSASVSYARERCLGSSDIRSTLQFHCFRRFVCDYHSNQWPATAAIVHCRRQVDRLTGELTAAYQPHHMGPYWLHVRTRVCCSSFQRAIQRCRSGKYICKDCVEAG